jgi:hypothetical protein
MMQALNSNQRSFLRFFAGGTVRLPAFEVGKEKA